MARGARGSGSGGGGGAAAEGGGRQVDAFTVQAVVEERRLQAVEAWSHYALLGLTGGREGRGCRRVRRVHRLQCSCTAAANQPRHQPPCTLASTCIARTPPTLMYRRHAAAGVAGACRPQRARRRSGAQRPRQPRRRWQRQRRGRWRPRRRRWQVGAACAAFSLPKGILVHCCQAPAFPCVLSIAVLTSPLLCKACPAASLRRSKAPTSLPPAAPPLPPRSEASGPAGAAQQDNEGERRWAVVQSLRGFATGRIRQLTVAHERSMLLCLAGGWAGAGARMLREQARSPRLAAAGAWSVSQRQAVVPALPARTSAPSILALPPS